MKQIVLWIAGTLAPMLTYGQSAALKHRLDSITQNHQWAFDIPGYVAAVIQDGRVIHLRAIGVESTATAKPVTTRSDFHMASVSKPFAATAILHLRDQGKLDLDSPLVYYLPYFRMKEEEYINITLRHILTHSSGIPDVTDYQWDHPQTGDGSAEVYVRSFSDKQLDFSPGSEFRYSNAAYDLLASVIADISGLSFEEYVRKNILLPAGMRSSSFLLADITEEGRAAPHEFDDALQLSPAAVYPYNRIHAPSSTLHANLLDMIQWARIWLNKGTGKDGSVLQASTWEEMLMPQRRVNDEYQVCLSWFETMIEGHKVYFHSGGDTGFRTFVGFAPSENAAVILMGNNDLFDGAQAGFRYFRALFSAAPVAPVVKSIHLELRKLILTSGIISVKERYEREKQSDPLKYDTSSGSILQLAGLLFDHGHRKETTDVLQWGASLYPGDGSWLEHLGDVHAAWQDKQAALMYYRRALVLTGEIQRKSLDEKIRALEKE
ncbi:beta-lactamase family protein [Terrimonas sp. NA20]|uniref:Beta-lactamase family protein n=1 Tax=Terrimonas ginsenosidimutans TaxID=2908004 RepID=A0ABS9KXB3_9BACT|nr:serine hydrolase domain-containing protein [Terrimonas ginsenosidimutans]MCG2616986.1 beta-lactamase family protein [Terrimonas ginsenosidimutans]